MIISITIDNVADAIGAFLQPLVNSATIIRAQVNRVAMPEAPFIVLTELNTTDLETPSVSNISDTATYNGPKQTDWQIDFYGDSAGDLCNIVKTMFRTSYASDAFKDGIKPLYCSNGMQGALTNAEHQYESRWTLTASFQYNPTVSLPQQSANALAFNIVEDLP